MLEYTIQNKVNLLTKNFEELKEVDGSWQMGMLQHSCALSLAIKNKYADYTKIEECIKIIKKNTGIFSIFRGNNLFYTATLLSTKVDIDRSFNEILEIHKKLKEKKFWNDEYLPFVANIIYENKDKIDLDECIDKMKYTYDFMKKHHPFLTSSDDYCRIALIAIYSKDLDNDLEYIEKCYEYLSYNGFVKSNNLQALSHIMCFNKNKTEEGLKRLIEIKKILKEHDCKLDGYGYPLIGGISLLDCNEEELIKNIKDTSEKLKEVKGFGNWRLGKNNRNMISAAIVASSYADYLQEESNLDIISNNIFLEIVIAIEIACTVAMISAVSASAASSTN